MRPAQRSPVVRRYDAAVLESRRIEWSEGRAELETLDVAGRRTFEVCQPHHLLGLPLDGEPRALVWRYNGACAERSTLTAGQVTLLPAGEGAVGFTEGRGVFRRLLVFLDPDAIAREAGVGGPLRLRESIDLPGARLRRAMVALAREIATPGGLGRTYLEALGASIAREVVRHEPRRRRPGGLSTATVRRVTDYVEAHLGDDLSLAVLAALAGLSLVHFTREFKRATGVSPHRYVLTRRVDRARALLARADCSLTGVALAVGFSSQSHLTTAFGRATGMTPAAYRRREVGRTGDPIGS